MKWLEKYRLGFDIWGLLLFLLVMLPNIILRLLTTLFESHFFATPYPICCVANASSVCCIANATKFRMLRCQRNQFPYAALPMQLIIRKAFVPSHSTQGTAPDEQQASHCDAPKEQELATVPVHKHPYACHPASQDQ